MKTFVRLCAASLLALAVLGTGMAEADRPAKKRKPTFFEQVFGGNGERRKTDRRLFRNRDRGDFLGIRIISQPAPNNMSVAAADEDPEAEADAHEEQSESNVLGML